MSETIEKLRFLKKLESMFSEEFDSARHYGSYSEEEYILLFSKFKKNINSDKVNRRSSISNFLYSGCLTFDRFNAPTPFVYERKRQKYFSDFLEELIKSERNDPTNTATFSLRDIRNRMYGEFDGVQIDSIDSKKVLAIKNEVEQVCVPSHPIKLKEFQEEKYKVSSILQGISDASLKTSIKTRIPFIVHASPLELTTVWENVNVIIKARPRFTQCEGSFITTDAVIQQKSPSRWNSGYTEIDLIFDALIDCDLYEVPLQAIHKEKSPVNGWPKCFNIAFDIVRKVSWSLRLYHGGLTQWIPAPTDIGDIEWCLSSSMNDKIEWKIKSSPSALMHVFNPPETPISIDLGRLSEPEWSEQCRSFSIMYLEMGQNEEALFWLNVGVEALFYERIPLIAEASGLTTLEDDLISPKTFWSDAENIVSSQYPELKDKIKWPEKKVHVSLFTKLKHLFEMVNMQTKYRELIKQYSHIQRFRNDLFHGRKASIVKVEDVIVGIESFDWIRDNFRLSGSDNS